MKRIFSVILCILMIASLAACTKGGTSQGNPTATTNKPSATQAATEIEINNAHLFGEYYGNSYCNTAMNIGISFRNEWILASTADIAELNGMDEQEMLTNFNALMKDTQTAYILSASDTDGVTGANIVIENLKLSGNENITGSEYIEKSEEITKETLQEAGASNIMITPNSVLIGGRSYAVQTLSYMMDGYSVYQEQILFPLGDYMAILTLSGDTESILNRIYPLD